MDMWTSPSDRRSSGVDNPVSTAIQHFAGFEHQTGDAHRVINTTRLLPTDPQALLLVLDISLRGSPSGCLFIFVFFVR